MVISHYFLTFVLNMNDMNVFLAKDVELKFPKDFG